MSTYLPTVFGENLMDMFDDFDRNFFRGFGRPEHVLYGKNASRLMKTDVKETDEGYEVDIDLPGFNKDEIKVDLNNGYLTISTEKSLNKENKGKMLAKFENGVLSLMIPKKEAPKVPEKKQILIEG